MPKLSSVASKALGERMEQIETLLDDVALLQSKLAVIQGDYILTKPGLDIGTTSAAKVKIVKELVFQINGVQQAPVAAATEVTIAGASLTPSGAAAFMAFRFEVGTNGTVDAVAATDNDTGYASEALALAGLPAVAADHAVVGFLKVQIADGATFDPGTTVLSAAGVTDTYTDGTTVGEALAALDA